MVKASRGHGFVPSRDFREARTRTALSRSFLGTDSVRSKLPLLYMPASPSPVSREARRDLWRSIGPSTMVVFTL